MALMMCKPTVSCAVENVAVTPVSEDVPRTAELSLKTTVPVGVPEPCGVTEAMKFTGCPKKDGFNEELTAVLVVVISTISRIGKPRACKSLAK
jgi:hypothetical protein